MPLRRLAILFLCVFASLRLCVEVQAAESPTFIPFQGRITDQAGNTYTNGQYTILFQLYNQAVGGQSIWQERHDKVGVVNGLVPIIFSPATQALLASFLPRLALNMWPRLADAQFPKVTR